MSERRTPPWPLLALGLACAGAIAAAVLLVGPAPAEQASVPRTATVARGVVQSTVSGSGNLAPASQLDLGFATAGTVTHIYVHEGEQVVKGQLLATLDPQSAEVTLQQARANLQSAEAALAVQEETDGEGTSRQASASSSAASTTPAVETPAKTKTDGRSEQSTKTSAESSEAGSSLSAATREANIASARAAVRSDRLGVQSDEQAVANTRLYAPEDGTIASLSGQVGEVVSGSGTSRATGSESSSSSASSASSRGASTGASTSSASSSSGGSSFAVLTDLSSMRLVVPLSESEISSVHRGQIATVTVEALDGRKLAAHVGEVAILSTSNSGVVSYDVTFVLDQTDAELKPGMSASAEVVVKQAQGLNVPSSAISRGTVTVLKGSTRQTRQVLTGLAGDTSTIVRSGLKAGETVVLPAAATSSTGSSVTGALQRLRGLSGGLSGGLGAGGTGGPAAVPGGGFPRGGG